MFSWLMEQLIYMVLGLLSNLLLVVVALLAGNFGLARGHRSLEDFIELFFVNGADFATIQKFLMAVGLLIILFNFFIGIFRTMLSDERNNPGPIKLAQMAVKSAILCFCGPAFLDIAMDAVGHVYQALIGNSLADGVKNMAATAMTAFPAGNTVATTLSDGISAVISKAADAGAIGLAADFARDLLFPITIIGALITIILYIFAFVHFISFAIDVGQRYVILGILYLIAPLPLSTGGNPATEKIQSQFIKTFFTQLIDIVFCHFLFCLACFGLLNILGQASETVIFKSAESFSNMVMLLAFLRIAQNSDQLLSKIGFAGSTTGYIGGRASENFNRDLHRAEARFGNSAATFAQGLRNGMGVGAAALAGATQMSGFAGTLAKDAVFREAGKQTSAADLKGAFGALRQKGHETAAEAVTGLGQIKAQNSPMGRYAGEESTRAFKSSMTDLAQNLQNEKEQIAKTGQGNWTDEKEASLQFAQGVASGKIKPVGHVSIGADGKTFEGAFQTGGGDGNDARMFRSTISQNEDSDGNFAGFSLSSDTSGDASVYYGTGAEEYENTFDGNGNMTPDQAADYFGFSSQDAPAIEASTDEQGNTTYSWQAPDTEEERNAQMSKISSTAKTFQHSSDIQAGNKSGVVATNSVRYNASTGKMEATVTQTPVTLSGDKQGLVTATADVNGQEVAIATNDVPVGHSSVTAAGALYTQGHEVTDESGNVTYSGQVLGMNVNDAKLMGNGDVAAVQEVVNQEGKVSSRDTVISTVGRHEYQNTVWPNSQGVVNQSRVGSTVAVQMEANSPAHHAVVQSRKDRRNAPVKSMRQRREEEYPE